jgi:predicted transcriptional regulator/DNA-binding XRE family transcriptional regulator
MNHKLFLGAKLRRFREQQQLSQGALAKQLGLSLSYMCQLENNQRPLTAAVLMRLAQQFQLDLGEFSEAHDQRLISGLQTLFRDKLLAEHPVGVVDLKTLVEQLPSVAEALLALHQRQQRLQEEHEQLIGRFYGEQHAPHLTPLPHEEVRDFFYRRNNYIDSLDVAAESLAGELGLEPEARAEQLQAYVEQQLKIAVMTAVTDEHTPLRRYDAAEKVLWLAPGLGANQRAFQLATQLAVLRYSKQIRGEVKEGGFAGEAAPLASIGLAHYFAGALLMPYAAFRGAAQQFRYDIERLKRRFQVSFEQVCHRLSTLQRSGARGVPFYFVRVDQAGNISKRQSATPFHFARSGGACPLWHVHDAFATPGRLVAQVAEMPDGSRFFGIARTVERGGGGWLAPRKYFAIGLGCELSHAHELVYADGIDLQSSRHVVPIGPGCRVCLREHCAQRAFPPAGRAILSDSNGEWFEPYRFAVAE